MSNQTNASPKRLAFSIKLDVYAGLCINGGLSVLAKILRKMSQKTQMVEVENISH